MTHSTPCRTFPSWKKSDNCSREKPHAAFFVQILSIYDKTTANGTRLSEWLMSTIPPHVTYVWLLTARLPYAARSCMHACVKGVAQQKLRLEGLTFSAGEISWFSLSRMVMATLSSASSSSNRIRARSSFTVASALRWRWGQRVLRAIT